LVHITASDTFQFGIFNTIKICYNYFQDISPIYLNRKNYRTYL